MAGGTVTFTARVTGNPAAGVQQVWVTWTSGPNAAGNGTWAPVDLVQDANDSTLWTGTLPLNGASATGMRFLVQAASGAGTVSLDTGDGDGYGVTDANALPATVFLTTHAPTTATPDRPASPLGVTAGVIDSKGLPVAGRDVRFTVWRGNDETKPFLYRVTPKSLADGSAELGIPVGKNFPPVGDLHVRADLLGAGSGVESTATVNVHVADTPVTVTTTPAYLTARAGTGYPPLTPLTATVSDEYATVPGYPVTFSLPTDLTKPTAAFVGPANSRFSSATVNTDANGKATAPSAVVAGTVPGVFVATITAGNATTTVPMVAQYGISAFESPVNNGANAVNGGSGNLPLKFSALLANNAKVSDAEAASLTSRIQLRWRLTGTTGNWSTRGGLATYDATRDWFLIDLKTTALGMKKNSVYDVQVRILPATADPKPVGYDAGVTDNFDVGSRGLKVKAEK